MWLVLYSRQKQTQSGQPSAITDSGRAAFCLHMPGADGAGRANNNATVENDTALNQISGERLSVSREYQQTMETVAEIIGSCLLTFGPQLSIPIIILVVRRNNRLNSYYHILFFSNSHLRHGLYTNNDQLWMATHYHKTITKTRLSQTDKVRYQNGFQDQCDQVDRFCNDNLYA